MGMIVDQQVTSILQRDGIDRAIGIGQIDCFKIAPVQASIRRRCRKNLTSAVTVTTQCLDRAIRMPQQCRLNRAERFPVMDRRSSLLP